MNESDFENDLRAHRPAPPSKTLAGRIAAELNTPRLEEEAEEEPLHLPSSAMLRLRGGIERLCWAGLGAAAAVWMMHWSAPHPPSGTAKVAAASHLPAPQPWRHEEEFAVADEGVHFVQADTPIKKVRRVVLERQAWADPKGGGTLEVQWPREDVIYQPVPVQ